MGVSVRDGLRVRVRVKVRVTVTVRLRVKGNGTHLSIRGQEFEGASVRPVRRGERHGPPGWGDAHPRLEGVGSRREHPLAALPSRGHVVNFDLKRKKKKG